jgi:hypothetical protein
LAEKNEWVDFLVETDKARAEIAPLLIAKRKKLVELLTKTGA